MKHIFKIIAFLVISVFSIFYLSSCREKNDKIGFNDNDSLLIFTHALMHEWYFWNEELPDLDPLNFKSAEDLLEALIYKPIDRFSYITDKVSFNQYFEEGKYIGHGFSSRFDADNKLRISLVYEDSPADKVGIKRGWEILRINGKDVDNIQDFSAIMGENREGIQNNFVFIDNDRQTKNITISKQNVDIRSVVYKEIYEIEGIKTGYLVFNSFIATSIGELDEAFVFFKSNNIENLIVDIRYNGGGMSSVANYLACLIDGLNSDNKIFFELVHNQKQTSKNLFDTLYVNENSVNIDKLVFITSHSSASASELLINGLSPYKNVVLVGDDTYGKPVGMYAWEYKDKMIVPIVFKVVNSINEGDYFSGIKADSYQLDDLTHDFGDPNEMCLKEALQYIRTGAFSGSLTKKLLKKGKVIELKGIQAEINAF